MPGTPTGTLFATQQNRFQEIIGKQIIQHQPAMDSVWNKMGVSSMGVVPADQLGRDFKVLRVHMGSMTGVIEGGGPSNDSAIFGDPGNTALGDTVHTQSLSETFPDPEDGAVATPGRMGIPLRSMRANLLLTLSEAQAEATPAFIGQVISPKLVGFAAHMARALSTYFYLSQNNFYRLSYLGGGAGTGWTTAEAALTLVIDTKQTDWAWARFHRGMRVQIFDSTGVTRRETSSGATTTFVVVAVDTLLGKVYLRDSNNADLTTFSSTTLQNGDIIVWASTKGTSTTPFTQSPYFTGIAGLNSYIKGGSGGNDNYLLGAERDTNNATDVTIWREFQSMVHNLAGASLTEHTLRRILARWNESKGIFGQTLDTLIASEGVWLKYESTKIGREYLDRTGRLSSLSKEGSEQGMSFTYNGRKIQCVTSSFVESGTVYGHRFNGGNWKRIVPPAPKGVRKSDQAPAGIPFLMVATALGYPTPFVPVHRVQGNKVLLTEGMGMPSILRMQVVPWDQIPGLKLLNVAEDRLTPSQS